MYRIESKVNTSSDNYKENYKLNKEQHADLKERLEKIKAGGPERAQKVHLDRGKLPTRERVSLLFDKNTPFLENSSLPLICFIRNGHFIYVASPSSISSSSK